MSFRAWWVLEISPTVNSRPTRSRKARTSVVLPEPISPVMTQKPACPVKLYSSRLRPMACRLLRNRNSGSGSRLNGLFFRLKNASYISYPFNARTSRAGRSTSSEADLRRHEARRSGVSTRSVQQCPDNLVVAEQICGPIEFCLCRVAAAGYEQHALDVGQES